jgi:hypothetical protein
MAAPESIKEQVVDNVPKRIKELKFGIPYVSPISAAISSCLAEATTDQLRIF